MTPQKLTRYDRGELDTNDLKVQLGRYIAAFLVGDAKRVGERVATQTRNAVRNTVIGVEPADLSRTLAEIIASHSKISAGQRLVIKLHGRTWPPFCEILGK
jgi:hypothetical protein